MMDPGVYSIGVWHWLYQNFAHLSIKAPFYGWDWDYQNLIEDKEACTP
jgi:hypothetical protein